MEIRCPNCGFEGEAKMEPGLISNTLFWLSVIGTIFAFFFATLTVWPWVLLALWLIMGVLTAFVTLRPVCPQCRWKYVVRPSATSSPHRPSSTERP